jgi:hypothetical protein
MTLRSLLLLFVGCAAVARAYPPAPGETLYGTVREERGRVWAKGAAWVIVSNDAGEIGRTLIHLAPEEGVNDAVHVPMDSGTVGAHDTPTALQPTVGFTGDAETGWTSRLGSTVTMTAISNCAKLHLQSYSTAEN